MLKESQSLQDPLTNLLVSHKHSWVMSLQNWGRRRGELSSTWGTTEEYNFPPISLVLWPQISQVNAILLVTSYTAQCPSSPERQLCTPITCEPLCNLSGSDGMETSAERIEVPQWKLRAFEHLLLAFFSITNVTHFTPSDSMGPASGRTLGHLFILVLLHFNISALFPPCRIQEQASSPCICLGCESI